MDEPFHGSEPPVDGASHGSGSHVSPGPHDKCPPTDLELDLAAEVDVRFEDLYNFRWVFRKQIMPSSRDAKIRDRS